MKAMTPPRGSMRMDGAFVTALTQAPSGAFYVAREGAETVLIPAHELAERIEVVL